MPVFSCAIFTNQCRPSCLTTHFMNGNMLQIFLQLIDIGVHIVVTAFLTTVTSWLTSAHCADQQKKIAMTHQTHRVTIISIGSSTIAIMLTIQGVHICAHSHTTVTSNHFPCEYLKRSVFQIVEFYADFIVVFVVRDYCNMLRLYEEKKLLKRFSLKCSI